ncbi:hypothetical protein O1611_g3344 [Lasiodiplodia mahajangana]|uniref:Uncharacterized protein n=1 Tax=Lasiodiplodia mahajangana TaxID=1108764 RepID=A0ACC2JSF7_9PEZI|nr:hypothetical protein O1611_g3344 [Lasiodiplodia mahajangana]
MRFLHSFVTPLVLLAAGAAQAASSWGFDDATVQVNAKKAAGSKEKFSEAKPLSQPVTISNTESVKVLLVAKDGGKGKRPHQAFVVLQDELSGLEAPFPMTVKENGKAVVEIVRHLTISGLNCALLPTYLTIPIIMSRRWNIAVN